MAKTEPSQRPQACNKVGFHEHNEGKVVQARRYPRIRHDRGTKPVSAKNYYNKGYRFCVRYIGRSSSKSPYVDISLLEAQTIVDAGLVLTVVQHPLAAGWTPTEGMGSDFGNYAALAAGKAGLLPGTNLWLDLEGVKDGVSSSDVIAYRNAWFEEVEQLGFVSGIYIGAAPGLTADQLYWDLKTKHYWKGAQAPKPACRTTFQIAVTNQLIQRISNPRTSAEFDSNVTRTDAFGLGVMWIASAGAEAMV